MSADNIGTFEQAEERFRSDKKFRGLAIQVSEVIERDQSGFSPTELQEILTFVATLCGVKETWDTRAGAPQERQSCPVCERIEVLCSGCGYCLGHCACTLREM